MVSSKLSEEEADAGTLLLPLYADSAAKLIQSGEERRKAAARERSGRRFSGRDRR